MEQIKHAFNIISKMNKEINELFSILENLNINNDYKKAIIQLFIDFDMVFGEFEMRLEEIIKKMEG